MRFLCDFACPHDSSLQVTVPVELSADECRAVRAMRRDGDPHVEVKAKAFALRTAYRLAPPDYVHVAGGTRPVWES
jgi:hypothetical protein